MIDCRPLKIFRPLAVVLLALALGSWAAAAGADTLTVTPATPTTTDHVVIAASVDPVTSPPVQWSLAIRGNVITVTAVFYPICPQPPLQARQEYNLGALPSGVYQIVLQSPAGVSTSSFLVSSQTQGLALLADRFQVTLFHGATLSGSQITGGTLAPTVQLSDHSGYFWMYDSGDMEVTVKMLDGSAVNGDFWLFAASMTDQPFVLKVVDTHTTCDGAPCVRLYANPAGTNQNFIDLAAFPH